MLCALHFDGLGGVQFREFLLCVRQMAIRLFRDSFANCSDLVFCLINNVRLMPAFAFAFEPPPATVVNPLLTVAATDSLAP